VLLQTLLPKIVELWERLHVPLVHRSRFFLAFRGRETFYYEVRAPPTSQTAGAH
jgi:hypothetical protein